MGFWNKKTERDRLLEGRANFRVVFSKSQVAAALWDHGEDALAEVAIGMSDDDLAGMRKIAACLEDPAYPVPLEGQRITHRHVSAFAAIVFYEGALRPLKQAKSRPSKSRPTQYTPIPAGPGEY